MTDDHLSIGEVLTLLQDEFPEVTISKIRFLESQGLIDPERTPSGYRKFYPTDIDRLRWILVQQRENFLPLKVIKDRLDSAEGVPADEPTSAAEASPVPPSEEASQAALPADPIAVGAVASTPTATETVAPVAPAPRLEPATRPNPTVRASMVAGEVPGASAPEPIWMADVVANKSKPGSSASGRSTGSMQSPGGEVSLTADEVCTEAGISPTALRELEQFGLLFGRAYGSETYYDADALLIATKSAAFLSHGIGARHLRMFKVSAEREAGFLEQVAMPLLKQRNPEARRQAVELVEELADLGHDLRGALLRANLRQHLDRA